MNFNMLLFSNGTLSLSNMCTLFVFTCFRNVPRVMDVTDVHFQVRGSSNDKNCICGLLKMESKVAYQI